MRLLVLCSGRGSNLAALAEHKPLSESGIAIAAVICNTPEAGALHIATHYHIPAHIIDHRHYQTRAQFEQQLIHCIDQYTPDLIVLAGFMRILTPLFIDHYQGKLINIHPSLLPAYKGLNTHERVLITGDRYHGCTVHYVSTQLDSGNIIASASLEVPVHMTAEQLADQVLALEHRLLPQVILALKTQTPASN